MQTRLTGLQRWLALGFTAALLGAASPASAGATQSDHPAPVVLKAQRLHVRPGHVLENAQVLIERGRIMAVGTDIQVPEGAEVIEGKVVCASFLDPWATFGLSGDSLRDGSTGPTTRTADGLDHYSDEHQERAIMRSGITGLRLQAGSNSTVGGIGALVRLPLDSSDASLLLEDAAVAMRVSSLSNTPDPFGAVSAVDRLAKGLADGWAYRVNWNEYNAELEAWQKGITEKEEKLNKDFKKAKKDREKDIEKAEDKGKEHKDKSYKEDKKPRMPKYDADKAVMARVAVGELPLVVEAHREPELRALLKATADMPRLRMILAGGTEALFVAEHLAARRIPVIVSPRPLSPLATEGVQGVDLALAGRLAQHNVSVLLGTGSNDPMASRELPLLAGMAVGHGLDYDKALHALTLGAARALDVSDRVGSVERGKDADLLVLDGDPLVSTSRVQFVLSRGRVVLRPEDQ